MKNKITLVLIFLLLLNCKASAQFLTRIWNGVTSLVQPVWGAYSEGGSPVNKTPPLTVFDRKTDIYEQVKKIKEHISETEDPKKYKDIYTQIYKNATVCADDSINCDFASQAKDAAFVFLMGINADGDTLNSTSNPTRASFKQKYLDLIYNWPANHNYTGKSNQFYRARENILLIQGYDFLQLAEWTGAGSEKLSESERERVKETIWETTWELHRWANNPLGAYGIWPIRPDNNMTLLVAAACGMGAIAVHDRTTYLINEQRKPHRWASTANAYINRVMWNDTKSMSELNKRPSAGYAEGPFYYRVAFDALWPYFLSFRNFTGGEIKRFGPYYKCALCFTGEYLNNFYADSNYLDLNEWYINIRQPNGTAPAIDDTRLGKTYAGTALDGNPKHSVIERPRFDLYQNLNIKADYLGAFNFGKANEESNYVNLNSGDLIIRNTFGSKLKDKHYLHFNAENGSALNGGKPHQMPWFGEPENISWGHEHGDVGSILISAGEDVLAIDPPLFGDKNVNAANGLDNFEINQGVHHNVITVSDEGPEADDNAIFASVREPIQTYSVSKIKTHYWNRLFFEKIGYRAKVEREVETVKLRYGMKYVITDNVVNEDGTERTIRFNWNGNGNIDQDTSFYIESGHPNSAVWNYPCKKDNNPSDNWQMRLTLTSIDNNQAQNSDLEFTSSPYHGNGQLMYTSIGEVPNNELKLGAGNICDINYPMYGQHTRASSAVSVAGHNSIQFKAIVEVFPCSLDWGTPPLQKVTSKYNSQVTIDSNIIDLHFSRTAPSIFNDSSTNPLYINDSAILETNSKTLFFSYSLNPEFKSGNCVSYCNFRTSRMVDGTIFKYHDTTYLESTHLTTAFYSIIGKCKYRAYTEADTACTVSFYLPDVEKGVGMMVTGYVFTFDTTTNIISVNVPVGFSEFEIELSDPCRVSCFFPSTAETIDEQFDFNEGITQTLGHKLSIVQPHGFLNISKGSHMMLCEGIYLHNRDSLVLFSGCGKDTGQVNITMCNSGVTGKPYGQISGFGGGAKASKITVKIGAALILEDSSFTQISNNSELHVFGTLVIKRGAKLLIGDNRTCSYATIMVYPGAYVHIEDDAHLEFLKIIGDTHDRHIVFIANKPYGAGAQKGIASSILPLLQNDTIISSANVPVDICDLHTVTPTHGIANRDWGFCNLLAPKALIKIPNDTICEGECLLIDFKSSLNDPIREIEVCVIDTFLGMVFIDCFGTWQLDGNILSVGYNESSTCYSSNAHLSYFPLCDFIDSTNRWFRLTVTVKNHCDQQDTQIVYFYVANKPNSLMALADSACPGYETVTAYNLSENNAEKAIWHVHLLDSAQHQENDENPFYYGGDWEQFNIHYGDSFTFPGFNWVGGFKYVVNLTQVGRCGEAVSKWDTIEIQPGAKIMASPSTVYSNPLGPSALQLQAFIGNANSFTWSPTSYLDNPNSLNPIATPTDTITYYLTTSNGNCAAFDTLHIKHNTLAYAGSSDTVCSEPVLLGTNFDASLFFAYQYVENPSGVWTEMAARLALDSAYFDKVSIYLLSEEGKNALQSIASYQNYLGAINRSQFYTQAWYLNYFRQYHASHNYLDAFTFFEDEVRANGSLTAYIGSNPMYHLAALQTFLDHFENEFFYGSAVQLSSVWEKYTQSGSNWESLGQWDNQIKMWDSVQMPTLYKITVIDNVNSKVEFDQVQIWSDQPTTPAFFVQFQTDSTLYFTNVSEPVQSSNVYAWNFGDGSSSNQTNPIHTFPFFDSTYVVCLTANNLCGTYTYCDTLRVDSTGLIAYSFSRKVLENKDEIGSTAGIGIQITAYPNPLSNEVNFAYSIGQDFEKGEILLLNCLGQTIARKSLTARKGKFSMEVLESSGIYFYQVVIDGMGLKTGKLVKE